MTVDPLDSTYAPRTRTGARGRRRRLLAGVAIAAVAVGHWLYWYSPRERPATPSAPLARLLDGAGDWDRVVWLAHPHQNLGAVDQALGDLDAYLFELARVAEVKAPRVPRFGPFAVPPARELALAWDDDGGRMVGIARIHRGLGWLARLSGALAGNPWLRGGRASSGGSTYEVRWEGALWVVTREGTAEPDLAAAGGDVGLRGPRLAEARLARPTGPLAPGNFVLERHADGLEVRGGAFDSAAGGPEPDAAAVGALRLDLPDLALWVATADRAPVGGPGLFLLWEDPDSSVPRVATLQRGGGRNFRLPGESLLELVGKGEPALRLGWVARGTDRAARREALRIVPWLERNYPRPSSRRPWLAAAGRLAPRRAAGMLTRLATRLRTIPLVPPAEIARIEAGASLLRPLADCQRLTLEVWRQPDGVRLRLCPSGAIEDLRDDELEDASSKEDEWIDEGGRIR